MYAYIRSEPGLWTVGHYAPGTHKWVPESDHTDPGEAAARVAALNGSPQISPAAAELLGELRRIAAEVRERDAQDGGGDAYASDMADRFGKFDAVLSGPFWPKAA